MIKLQVNYRNGYKSVSGTAYVRKEVHKLRLNTNTLTYKHLLFAWMCMLVWGSLHFLMVLVIWNRQTQLKKKKEEKVYIVCLKGGKATRKLELKTIINTTQILYINHMKQLGKKLQIDVQMIIIPLISYCLIYNITVILSYLIQKQNSLWTLWGFLVW